MLTQNVERVVTIWLMPSMIDLARLVMASLTAPEAMSPTTQVMSPNLHSATSDSGPEYETAQIAELGDSCENLAVIGGLYLPVPGHPTKR
ncbi:hypothetical protein D9M72_532860 [compost metagenome]